MIKQQTLKDFAEKYNLQLELNKVPFRTDLDMDNPDDRNWNMVASHYLFRIFASNANDGIKFDITGNFSQGPAIKRKPKIEDILNALVCDTLNIDMSFEEWCSDYGYDTDSRKAYRIYESCRNEYKNLQRFLPANILAELYECEQL